MPRALIFAPQRRSMVSSMPITTGPLGTTAVIRSVSRQRAQARPDQRFRLSTRWKLVKVVFSRSPMMLSAEVTVRRPGARMDPATSTSRFCHVGRVKRAWKGAIHWARMAGVTDAGMRPARDGADHPVTSCGWEACHVRARCPAGAHPVLQPSARRWGGGSESRARILAAERAQRCSDCPAQADWRWRKGSGAVVDWRALGSFRPLRHGDHAARRRPELHRLRTGVLDPRLNQKWPKSSLEPVRKLGAARFRFRTGPSREP